MWEYRIDPISFSDLGQAADSLNAMGQQRWELIAIVPNATGKDGTWPVAIYKRASNTPKSN
jgi:hypothetical protein